MKFGLKILVSLGMWLCVVLFIFYYADLPDYNEIIMTGVFIAAFISSISIVVLIDNE